MPRRIEKIREAGVNGARSAAEGTDRNDFPAAVSTVHRASGSAEAAP